MALLLALAARMYEESVDIEDVGKGQRQIRIIALRSGREWGGSPTVCHSSDLMGGARLARVVGSSSSFLEAIAIIVQKSSGD